MKKVAILSDFHCGHFSGLTPPGWLPSKPKGKIRSVCSINKAHWDWFEKSIKATGPFDIVFVNGDCLDGKGTKSGGTELFTPDMEEQAEMAVEVISKVPKSKGCKIVLTRGTSYHTGEHEDWENIVAQRIDGIIEDQAWVNVEGVVFDLKHHPSGGSQVPHGRHTGVARDRLWNILHVEKGVQPRADIFIRSHVHYHNFAGGQHWLAMTTPALQGEGSKYGMRRCSGVVDFGFVTFEINKGEYVWRAHIAEVQRANEKTIKF